MNQILYRADWEMQEAEELPTITPNKKKKAKKQKKIIFPVSTAVCIMCFFIGGIYVFSGVSQGETKEAPISSTQINVAQENEEEQMIVPTMEEVENVTEKQQEQPQVQTYETTSGETYDVIATLDIDHLNIHYPVLSSTSDELLKVSLNKYWGANPHEVGNFCIIGHNYNDNKFFSNLLKIQLGDIVNITDTAGKRMKYKVYDTFVVEPTDTSCTSQLTNGKTEITLITCTNKGKSRFIVKAVAQ